MRAIKAKIEAVKQHTGELDGVCDKFSKDGKKKRGTTRFRVLVSCVSFE